MWSLPSFATVGTRTESSAGAPLRATMLAVGCASGASNDTADDDKDEARILDAASAEAGTDEDDDDDDDDVGAALATNE